MVFLFYLHITAETSVCQKKEKSPSWWLRRINLVWNSLAYLLLFSRCASAGVHCISLTVYERSLTDAR